MIFNVPGTGRSVLCPSRRFEVKPGHQLLAKSHCRECTHLIYLEKERQNNRAV